MPIRKHTPPDPYKEAAGAILKAIQEEFPGVRPKGNGTETVKALSDIMKHFLEKPKVQK